MPRNGVGVYTAPSNSWNPAVSSTTIDPSAWNSTQADYSQALSGSMAADGQTPTTATIPFAFGLSTANGLVGAPSITFTADPDTGFYRSAANQMAVTAGGTQSAVFTATGAVIPGKIDVTGVATAGSFVGPVTGNITGNADSATKWATPRSLSITGDLTYTLAGIDGTANGSAVGTLATVNSNVGTFGSATASSVVVVNAKGLVTGAASTTITPAVGSITGLGGGVATFLATPTSANLASAVSDETGTGALTFATAPTLLSPINVASSAAAIGAVVRGASSQSANIEEWQANGGGKLASLAPSGTLTIGSGTPTQLFAIEVNTFTTNTASQAGGILAKPIQAGVGLLSGGVFSPQSTSNTASGDIVGVFTDTTITGSSASRTNYFGFQVGAITQTSGATVTNAYGLFTAGMKVTGVTNGYGVYASGTTDLNFFGGFVGIGTAGDTAHSLVLNSLLRLKGYTVATLPSSPGAGSKAYVTDATAPTFLTTLVGGGSAYSGAQYSGSAWVSD